MSDVRKCDSPECDVETPLDSLNIKMYEISPGSFITLTRVRENDLHFHDRNCLNVWTMANLTVKKQ